MLYFSLQIGLGLMSNHIAFHIVSYTCFHLEGASANHRTSTVTHGQLRLTLAQAISNSYMCVTVHKDLHGNQYPSEDTVTLSELAYLVTRDGTTDWKSSPSLQAE